ncbi:MAG: hypothetical protein K2L76_08120 [Muribaculaceae bacterium]|nr:hypothetical protein [Muribaculaceae bacterium]
MKTFHYLLLALSVALAVTLGACSDSGNDLLETIPADAMAIVKIDAESLAKSAGCKKDGIKWVPGETLGKVLGELTSSEKKKIEDALALLGGIEAKNTFYFYYDNTPCITATMLDADRVCDAVKKELGEPESIEGFDVYDNCVIVRGKQLWFTNGIEKLKKMLEAAKKNPVGSNKVMGGYLSGDKQTMRIVVNAASVYKNFGGLVATLPAASTFANAYWCYAINLDGNHATFRASFKDADGKTLSAAEQMTPIDPAVAALMPDNPILACAWGKVSDEIMDAMLNNAGPAARNMLTPYLHAINGSAAFGVAAPASFNDLLKPAEWTLTMAIQYDEKTAGEILGMTSMLTTMGKATIEQLADQQCVTIPDAFGAGKDAKLYAGYINGMLAISTKPISAEHTNGLAKLSKGQCAVSLIDLPVKGHIAEGFKLPFGLTGTSTAADETCIGELTLDGSDKPVIESILALAVDKAFQRNAVETFNKLCEE